MNIISRIIEWFKHLFKKPQTIETYTPQIAVPSQDVFDGMVFVRRTVGKRHAWFYDKSLGYEVRKPL